MASSSEWRSGRSLDGGVDRIPVPAAGSLWVCGKHHIAPDPLAVIERLDIEAVVCLNQQHELVDRYPDYVAWLSSAGSRAIWHPVPDLHAPSLTDAVRLADEILRRLDNNHNVLIHCGAGVGRAGTMAAAVLVRRGVSLQRALDEVADSRPMAGPEAGAQRALLEAMSAAGPVA